MPCCDIFEKWKAEENLLRMYSYWIVSVRSMQPTLGSCIIILKRHVESFSEVSGEEMIEFLKIAKDLEKGLKNALSYSRINYLVFMMADRHFHFHVVPRYPDAKEFAGKTWNDESWPRPMAREQLDPQPEQAEMLAAIRDEIQK